MAKIVPVSVDHHYHQVISDKENNNPKGINYYYNHNINISACSVRRVLKGTIFLAAIVLACFIWLSSFNPFPIFLQLSNLPSNSQVKNEPQQLISILESASMKDRNNTVIITTLNDAWGEPNSIFELFLESFRIGKGTEGLLRHLVVMCVDDKAYARCLASHPHCYQLRTKGVNFTKEAFFMSRSYLELVWRKIEILGEVLEMGYSFVFTDCDIMWLRNPFERFLNEADFQMSCDAFNGNSSDLQNYPNTGFMYVRSNPRTIQFYNFWNFSIKAYPDLHDQNILNKIKFDPLIANIGLKIRFLNTAYFGGFCSPSEDLNVVCTMHANCCVGLENKINDLTTLLEDWKRFKSSQPRLNPNSPWSVPQNCSTSFKRLGQRKSGPKK